MKSGIALIDVRNALIAKGVVKPGKAHTETVPCRRCDALFERIKGCTQDDYCGNLDCKDLHPPKPRAPRKGKRTTER